MGRTASNGSNGGYMVSNGTACMSNGSNDGYKFEDKIRNGSNDGYKFEVKVRIW